MTNGFVRIAAATPEIKVADVDFNTANIIAETIRLNTLGVKIAVFPELCVTGYTCGDLFHSQTLIEAAADAIRQISAAIRDLDIHIIVGAPLWSENALYNCAVLLRGDKIDIIKKSYIPTYNEFYERRWFAPSELDSACKRDIFTSHGVKIGIEICEDLWAPIPPSSYMSMSGAEIIFNLSASDDLIGKYDYLCSLIANQSGRCLCAYAYASAGYGESSTDLAFMPKTIIAETGTIVASNDRFNFTQGNQCVIRDVDILAIRHDRAHTTTFYDCADKSSLGNQHIDLAEKATNIDLSYPLTYRYVNPHPFVPADDCRRNQRCREITSIQECALSLRLKSIGSNRIVVGISGGLDSTLALLVAVSTINRIGGNPTDIIGVTMPGFGTTNRTYDNAITLMRILGITIREIPIAAAVSQHFNDIGHNPSIHDVTYENSQARERTQILMDIANQSGAIVLGTGDLSELALGWATYNGDHMSMYGINAGIPKTLVKYLVDWYATIADSVELKNILHDIIDTPISPELTPADENGQIKQKTEDLVGPYELHDFFLYYTLRYGFSPSRIFYLATIAFNGAYENPIIFRWLSTFYHRFFTQQFKRSCLPDGPKVGSVCLSPRGDWRMPSDASRRMWIKDLKNIENYLTDTKR